MLLQSRQAYAINKSRSLTDHSWLIQERMSSCSTTTEPLSRPWFRWWGPSGTGWMRTAPSCTTSIWWSSWPCARRARTSTQRSNATPCSRWMTLSAWWPTRTASPRWATVSPGWVGSAHISPCGGGVVIGWELTQVEPHSFDTHGSLSCQTSSGQNSILLSLDLCERNDQGSKSVFLSPWGRTGNCCGVSALEPIISPIETGALSWTDFSEVRWRVAREAVHTSVKLNRFIL